MLSALRHAMEFRPGAISVGTVLSNSYRVLGKVGEGGMGAVYDVTDTHRDIKKPQVLKILTFPPSCCKRVRDMLRERFRRECEVLHNLQHEAIPHIYGNLAI